MLSIAPDEFRRTLGLFPTGVTVMTAIGDEGRPVGVTISAFSSLSLSPPLVLFCLDKQTAALSAFTEGSHFVANILANTQENESAIFASPEADRFKGIDYETGASGCPVLTGAAASLECRRTALHDGGDHVIIVGAVETVACDDGATPLVYVQGRYRSLEE